MKSDMLARNVASKDLHSFKALLLFVFVVYAIVLTLWFAFYEHNYLQDHERWSDVVASRTRSQRVTHSEGIPRGLNDENDFHLSKHKYKYVINVSYTGKINESDIQRNILHGNGRLLSMTWKHICCQSINCLRKYPLFPLFPSKTSFLRSLRVLNSEKLSGQRITGRLAPPKTGIYSFLVKCAATCEIWLGGDEYPSSSRLAIKVVRGALIAHNLTVNSTVGHRQARETKLSAGETYIIDVIFTVYRTLGRPLEVLWRFPNAQEYVLIGQPFLEGFTTRPKSLRKTLSMLSRWPSVCLTPFLESIEEAGEDDEDFVTIGDKMQSINTFFDHSGIAIPVNASRLSITGSFPEPNYRQKTPTMSLQSCPYRPSFVANCSLPKYSGVWRTSLSSVYPKDNTGYMICIGNRYPVDCQGNKVITRETIQKLLTIYTAKLSQNVMEYARTDQDYPLLVNTRPRLDSIVNIEEKSDFSRGSRFLVDAVLHDPRSSSTFLRSDYLYMDKHGTNLCSPSGYIADMSTMVNVVVVAKRQSRWLLSFLSNMERIFINTKDKRLNIVIAKYGSDDESLKEEYERTRLPSIRTVRQFGLFQKPKAIQSAVDTIQDVNSIIFLMDLHIVVPDTMITLVRKHTIKGKMVFNPILFRLSHCGSPASSTMAARGFWETFGYGILGIFKSDWDRIGGMTSKQYSHGWGGEDWELLDRIIAAGLEVERLRVSNFYHFYHSRKNMWT